VLLAYSLPTTAARFPPLQLTLVRYKMNEKKVLVIDSDETIHRSLAHVFGKAGIQVCGALDGQKGMPLLFNERPDLVFLEIDLPGSDSRELCRHIRAFTDTPVIFLANSASDEEIVRSLDAGADDFLIKPFNPEVLLARARAVLRRSEQSKGMQVSTVYQDGRLHIDLLQYKVLVCGQPVRLAPMAYRLLVYLIKNAGHVCTFEQILKSVWGWEYRDNLNYVHVYVSNLRQKIEEDPKNPIYILSEFGVGYRFIRQPSLSATPLGKSTGAPSPAGW
jgi:two-component system, OmpR family, KDP operon response regulator KdpE